MGWSEGQSLGKERDGPIEPVSPVFFIIFFLFILIADLYKTTIKLKIIE